MKLKKMTQYVLDREKNAPLKDYHKVNDDFVNDVINYANFLKQPLSEKMFIDGTLNLNDGFNVEEMLCHLREFYWEADLEGFTIEDLANANLDINLNDNFKL